MKLLTKDTDYAVRALLQLAQHLGEWSSSRSIANAEGVPLPYMRRILQVLVHEGWVHSREGADGGVQLARAPEELSLLDLIHLFQGDIKLSECLFRHRSCANRPTCPLRHRIESIRQKLEEQFGAITLASLLQDLTASKPSSEKETGPGTGSERVACSKTTRETGGTII
jgi:Rrf2 family protein